MATKRYLKQIASKSAIRRGLEQQQPEGHYVTQTTPMNEMMSAQYPALPMRPSEDLISNFN